MSVIQHTSKEGTFQRSYFRCSLFSQHQVTFTSWPNLLAAKHE